MEPRTTPFEPYFYREPPVVRRPPPPPPKDRYWLHLLLFFLTLVSTTFTGAILFVGRFGAYADTQLLFVLPSSVLGAEIPITTGLIADGLRFALSLLGFLTVHEFGHYFAARHHRISTSLPYYLPTPFIGWGTLGAVIRIREPIPSIRKLFDIGAAGPLAGFVVALGLLLYGLATLPSPQEFLGPLGGHEDIIGYINQHGRFPELMPELGPNGMAFVFGETILYKFLVQFVPGAPPMWEINHYPVLLAGWLGLFFTALNLLPVGQLDGGHILYALVGPVWHRRLARAFVCLVLTSAAIGFAFLESFTIPYAGVDLMQGELEWVALPLILFFYLWRVFDRNLRLALPATAAVCGIAALARFVVPAMEEVGYPGWFIFGLLIVFLVKVDHPPVLHQEPLTPARRALGILCILIFILCFSLRPIHIIEGV